MSVLLRRPMLSMPFKSSDPRKRLFHIRDNILVWGTVHSRFPALLAVVEQELAQLGELP
jgi:hypothetical protein